jgi:outer membrane protein with beta-barrel domain
MRPSVLVHIGSRSTHGAAVIALVLLCGAASPVCGQEARAFGVSVFGGYSTYSMGDLNDAIEEGGFFPVTSVTADEIDSGAMFGVGIRFRQSDRVSLAFDVARLLASTSGSALFLGTPVDGELKVPSTSVTFTVQYLFPSSSRIRAGLGGGAGYYFCGGEASGTSSAGSRSADLDGSGFGFHGLVLGEWTLSRTVHAEIGAGYRYAKTADLEVEGSVLLNSDGSKSKVDWSGFTSKLGVTFYLPGT